MSNNFKITISAVDKATGVFRKINNSMSQTLRPAQRAQRALGALTREMHLDKLSKGLRSVSLAGQKVASSLGLAAGPMEALFGLGAAGGIIATGAAIIGLGARFGNLGFEVNRTAATIGVSTEDLQKYRGAAKLAGLSGDELTTSFANLGRTLQDAQFGRNPEAYTILNKFGIGIKRNKDGIVDTVATFQEMARVISQIADPHVQEIVANAFGIGSMLPLLRKGPAAVAELTEAAKKFGLVASGDALDGAQKFGESLNRLKGAIEGVANTWGSKLTPLLANSANMTTKALTERGFFGAMWDVLNGTAGRNFMAGDTSKRTSSGVVTGAPAVTAAPGGPLPLGLRLHNPGNLRIPGSTTGFQTFDDDQSGLNAMAQQVGRYGNRDGLHSISAILGKYAPSSENNTSAYVRAVSADTGFDANANLNTNDPKVLAPLLSAMVKHEQGRNPFSADQYAAAAQTVDVKVAFANAPAGTSVQASKAGSAVPARVSYALLSSDAP